VAASNQKSNNVELHGEKKYKGQLHDADPGVSVANAFPEVCVIHDGVPGHEVNDDGPVAQQYQYPAQGRWRSPLETDFGDVKLRMADFADDGRCCGPCLAQIASWPGRVFNRGIVASL
jgi:hypothetical protein